MTISDIIMETIESGEDNFFKVNNCFFLSPVSGITCIFDINFRYV